MDIDIGKLDDKSELHSFNRSHFETVYLLPTLDRLFSPLWNPPLTRLTNVCT